MSPEFLHALIHDLKGPVSRVRMVGEMLRRRTSGDTETAVLLEHIGTAAAAAEQVVDGLRRYVEATEHPLNMQPCDLSEAAKSAIARLAPEIRSSGAQVQCGELPRVRADLVQVALMFRELIGNSIRFRSDAPPLIEVVAAGEGAVAVIDNGIGIEPQAFDRIFRPFGKASNRSGAGMGLAICESIVKAHGGRIWVVARPAGSEVRFCLPSLTREKGPLQAL